MPRKLQEDKQKEWFDRVIPLFENGSLTLDELIDLCWTNLGNPRQTCEAIMKYALSLRKMGDVPY